MKFAPGFVLAFEKASARKATVTVRTGGVQDTCKLQNIAWVVHLTELRVRRLLRVTNLAKPARIGHLSHKSARGQYA
jgi:hypothetical protein